MSKHHIALICCGAALAQVSVVSVTDSRFHVPSYAKGEVFSVAIRIDRELPDSVAPAGRQWPQILAGVQILFSTSGQPGGGRPALIGSIHRKWRGTRGGGESLVFVEAQVPLDLPSNIDAGFGWFLKTSVDGVEIDSRIVNILPDRIVLERCDGSASLAIPVFGGLDSCQGRFYHEDGTEVSPGMPAKPGDRLHAFAFGLGQTDPPTIEGVPFAEGASIVGSKRFRFWIEYRINAVPRFALADDVTPISVATVSVVPGAVGRYRIDFELPPPPEGAVIERCIANSVDGGILSNATLNVRGNWSLGGGGFCVASNRTPEMPPPRVP